MLGDLLSAGTKIIGGIIGRNDQKDANERAEAAAAANRQLQLDFAQNAIQWKVNDAKLAGVHPLYALGAQTTSFNPVSVGHVGGSPLGEAIGSMGQDISRAVSAGSTKDQRQGAAVAAANALTLERGKLENELLKTRILTEQAKLTPAQTGAPFPQGKDNYLIPGQVQTPFVDPQKHEPVKGHPDNPNQEPGSITDVGFAVTPDGQAPVPSKDVKERIEDNFIQEVMWAVRNQLLPSMGINKSPPKIPLPPGHFWEYDPWRQTYREAVGMRRGWPIWANERR